MLTPEQAEKDITELGDALAAWLESQKVSTGVAVLVLAGLAGNIIGVKAKSKDELAKDLGTVHHMLFINALKNFKGEGTT